MITLQKNNYIPYLRNCLESLDESSPFVQAVGSRFLACSLIALNSISILFAFLHTAAFLPLSCCKGILSSTPLDFLPHQTSPAIVGGHIYRALSLGKMNTELVKTLVYPEKMRAICMRHRVIPPPLSRAPLPDFQWLAYAALCTAGAVGCLWLFSPLEKTKSADSILETSLPSSFQLVEGIPGDPGTCSSLYNTVVASLLSGCFVKCFDGKKENKRDLKKPISPKTPSEPLSESEETLPTDVPEPPPESPKTPQKEKESEPPCSPVGSGNGFRAQVLQGELSPRGPAPAGRAPSATPQQVFDSLREKLYGKDLGSYQPRCLFQADPPAPEEEDVDWED